MSNKKQKELQMQQVVEPKLSKKKKSESSSTSLEVNDHKSRDTGNTHLTAAYLQFEHRLENRYKLCEDPEHKSYPEIEGLLGMIPGNTTEVSLDAKKWFFRVNILFTPVILGIPYVVYYAKCVKFRVPANCFALVTDRSGSIPQTRIYGPGYHFLGMYYELQRICTIKSEDKQIISSTLEDLMIVTVDQGDIALFEYSGQYKILGPGLHLIKDPMNFLKMIRLDKFYIKVGPEKWLTIPEQYDGIALDNGKTVILKGGRQHHLSHENYKFAKLVPKILLTDRIVTDVVHYIELLGKTGGALPKKTDSYHDPSYYLQTKTKDGSVIYLDAMLFWQITNTKDAVHKAMNVVELKEISDEEDEVAHIERASRNINNLRMTVLRFAKAHLAEMVGCTSLTEDVSLSTTVAKQNRKKGKEKEKEEEPGVLMFSNQMSFVIQTFLSHQTETLLEKLNNDLNPYGVKISKITINDAIPTDDVQKQLDRQVKARIDQNTELVEAETKKRVAKETVEADRLKQLGTATNSRDAADIEKERTIILANADAEAEQIRAEGKKKAAEALSSVPLSRELALIEAYGKSGEKISGTPGDKVYFGLPLNEVASGMQQFGQMVNLFKGDN